MNIRSIIDDDYHKEYLNLINYFTRNIQILTYDEFKLQLYKKLSQNTHILVIETDNKIIATGAILIEYKLHNNFKNVGHIEDIIVDANFRKKSYGTKIIDELIKIGKNNNCYKIILNCNDDNIEFYQNKNFIKKGNEMCMYI